MSYKSVVNLIRGVSQAVNPTGLFVHGRKWDASLEFNEVDRQIYLYPMTAQADLSNHYYETYSCLMGFYFQDAPDSTNEQRESLIEQADILCRKFVTRLEPIENTVLADVRMEPSYRQNAGTYTGYILRFTLSVVENICEDCSNWSGVVRFTAVANTNTYNTTTVPALNEAVGLYLVSASVDASIILPNMRTWDGGILEFSSALILDGGEQITLEFDTCNKACYFFTDSGQNAYTIPEKIKLGNIVGQSPYYVSVDGSIIPTEMWTWDNNTFTFSPDLVISGGEYVVIKY